MMSTHWQPSPWWWQQQWHERNHPSFLRFENHKKSSLSQIRNKNTTLFSDLKITKNPPFLKSEKKKNITFFSDLQKKKKKKKAINTSILPSFHLFSINTILFSDLPRCLHSHLYRRTHPKLISNKVTWFFLFFMKMSPSAMRSATHPRARNDYVAVQLAPNFLK